LGSSDVGWLCLPIHRHFLCGFLDQCNTTPWACHHITGGFSVEWNPDTACRTYTMSTGLALRWSHSSPTLLTLRSLPPSLRSTQDNPPFVPPIKPNPVKLFKIYRATLPVKHHRTYTRNDHLAPIHFAHARLNRFNTGFIVINYNSPFAFRNCECNLSRIGI